jgi:hypothetical protein
MWSVISLLAGYFAPILPHLMDIWKTKLDNQQQLAMLNVQAKYALLKQKEKTEAVKIEADIAETQYKEAVDTAEIAAEAQAFSDRMKLAMVDAARVTGIKFVDALNAIVRPTLILSFFLFYASIKWLQAYMGMPVEKLWTDSDMNIFTAMIAFYFGQRDFKKLRP